MTLARCGGVAIAALSLLIGVDCGLANQYTIGPDDVLDVAVWNNTAISRTVPVRPDGKYRCRWSTTCRRRASPRCGSRTW